MDMELFTMICLALLGVLMLAGSVAMIGMMATLTVLFLRRTKCQFAVAWRRLWCREPAGVSTGNGRTGRNAILDEKEARIASHLVSDLIAAMGLTSISGYILWALAF
jgi:hypothetical protein